jgi:hypothetical protein
MPSGRGAASRRIDVWPAMAGNASLGLEECLVELSERQCHSVRYIKVVFRSGAAEVAMNEPAQIYRASMTVRNACYFPV